MNNFNPLKIKEIAKISNSAVSISFSVPEDLSEYLNFKPGQYINLKYRIQEQEFRRSYSICSVPNSEELQIVIKRIAQGVFSNYFHDSIKHGELIDVSKPEGNFFHLNSTITVKKYLAIAAGSGITPVFSIIQDILKNSNNEIELIYGNSTFSDAIFVLELIELSKQYPDRFKLQLFFSREKIEYHNFGRINLDQIASTHYLNGFETFYLCGPEGLINDTEKLLFSKNIGKNKIKHELFYSNNTSIVPPLENNNETTQIEILLDGQEKTYQISKNKLILDSLLDIGIDIPYSCQNGICSSCICQLEKGEVNILNNNVLNEDELESGKIILCQTLPISNHIKINYDV